LSQPWNPYSLIPLIDIKDIGKFITPALLQPDLYDGRSFTCATAFYTPIEMVDTWTKITGKTIRFQQTGDSAEHSTLSEAQKQALKGSKGLITEYSYFGPAGKRDLGWTLEQMTEKPMSWEGFVQENQPWF
jgi:hypothetical protein